MADHEKEKHLDLNWSTHQLKVGFAQPLLTGVNVSVTGRELIFVVGENGSGKSTLLRTLCGLQHPLQGQVCINGKNVALMTDRERVKYVALVSTHRPAVDGLTVKEVLETGRYIFDSSEADNDAAVLEEVAGLMQLDVYLNRYFGLLSDGEKQRVMVARALCQQTPFIVMDEPTAFLDFRHKQLLMNLLVKLVAQNGKTILISTHDLEHVYRYAGRCWVLKNQTVSETESGKGVEERLKQMLEA